VRGLRKFDAPNSIRRIGQGRSVTPALMSLDIQFQKAITHPGAERPSRIQWAVSWLLPSQKRKRKSPGVGKRHRGGAHIPVQRGKSDSASRSAGAPHLSKPAYLQHLVRSRV
jgi:hypothetical protein